MTWIVLKGIDATLGLRVSENDEREGLDASEHGEEAYGGGSGTSVEEEEATARDGVRAAPQSLPA